MSWFWRGAQSAVFYYLSCAPCSTFAHQRKRQRANRRAKAEKNAGEEADVGVYHHPSPFDTNVYWHEEMVAGPGPPIKRSTKEKGKSDSTRRLNTAGPGSSAGASSADTTMAVSTTDGMTEEKYGGRSSGDWNHKRYQRPDEVLWGFEDQISERGESIGMSAMGPSSTNSLGTYYTARNPAVNDLHPPVVSTPPTNRNEIRWMLQPPPSAKIMAGKAPANRSRSTTSSTGRKSDYQQIDEEVGLPRLCPASTSPSGQQESREVPRARQPQQNKAKQQMGGLEIRRELTSCENQPNRIAAEPSPSMTSGFRKHRPALSPINSFDHNEASTYTLGPLSLATCDSAADPHTKASGSSQKPFHPLIPSVSAPGLDSDISVGDADCGLPSTTLVDRLDLATTSINVPHLDPKQSSASSLDVRILKAKIDENLPQQSKIGHNGVAQ